MCIDPPGQRQPRFAVCSCGAYFPECDLWDARRHGKAEGASNHSWVYIREEWKDGLEKDKSK